MSSRVQAPPLTAELVSAGYDKQWIEYFGAVGVAILLYDYLLTFDLEITYIWRSAWTPIKVLYLCTRYIPFADTAVMVLYRDFLSGSSDRACYTAMGAATWMYAIGMSLAEIILLLRTWAIWGRNRWVGVGLIIHAAATFGGVAYSTNSYVSSTAFSPSPAPQIRGCFITNGSNILYIDWLLLMIMEFVYITLISVKAHGFFVQGRNITFMYRALLEDGVLYFMILFSLSLVNFVMELTPVGSIGTTTMLATPLRVIHSVLSARIVLHIRQVGAQGSGGNSHSTSVVESIIFDNLRSGDRVESGPTTACPR
ncbi:hypothetical protein BV22DRAFT_1089416 [Leucogyrophana mollusca]|uniref:Uncharacterized protein n=1 Tax=Leucogyrophana mollusca TaxID=85980 RepID=A0ACB8BHS3_9AGAM|nr:hypothetical protein BV22DRAFT_1089416 [Leucogyrophana mollusca]